MQACGERAAGMVLQAVLQHVQERQEERHGSGQVRRWRLSDLADFPKGLPDSWLKAVGIMSVSVNRFLIELI
jgi:hypothetical protein